MAKITFVAYEGCLMSGVANLMDAFTIANRWQEAFEKSGSQVQEAESPLFRTEIVTPGGKSLAPEECMGIHPNRAMEEVEHTDLVLIPPCWFDSPALRRGLPDVQEWIAGHYESNTRIGAICTGAFILAYTGLLDGKLATTNWQMVPAFRRRFPQVRLKPDRVLTEDSGLICSGAVTAMYNLALFVIELFGSQELLRVCAKLFLVDPSRNSQAPYMIARFRKNHGDKEIQRAQEWMEEHYFESIQIDDAADHVGLSPRHFKRRFKKATEETPLSYLQQIRLEAAKKRLETTTDNIDEITHQVGYEDSSTFRRLFKKYTELSPREYRDKFSICSSV